MSSWSRPSDNARSGKSKGGFARCSRCNRWYYRSSMVDAPEGPICLVCFNAERLAAKAMEQDHESHLDLALGALCLMALWLALAFAPALARAIS